MEIVTKIAPIALALIMLTLGLGLTIKDFTRVISQPKDFLLGVTCQLIILPIVAFILIKIFKTPLELALGVMIIAAAPGGVTSNVLTKFANGDVALSASYNPRGTAQGVAGDAETGYAIVYSGLMDGLELSAGYFDDGNQAENETVKFVA